MNHLKLSHILIMQRNDSKASEAGIGNNFGNSQGKNVLETKKWLVILSDDAMSIKCSWYAF